MGAAKEKAIRNLKCTISLHYYLQYKGILVFFPWVLTKYKHSCHHRKSYGSSYISGKLPSYPFPKPTFCPKWEVSVNVGLGEG